MRGNAAPASTVFGVTHLLTFTNADGDLRYLYGNQRLVENFQARLDQDGLPSDITALGGSLPLPVQSPVKEAVVRDDELVSVEQAAQELNRSRRAVRLYIERGLLRAEKVGASWVIRRDDLERVKGKLPKMGRPPNR